MAVKEQRSVAWQKVAALQIFSTASLKFGDNWENFGKWKKSFTLEVASCWQTFLQNNQKNLHSANKALDEPVSI